MIRCSFAYRQVEGQPSKKPKKDRDKRAVAILKDSRPLVCVFQDTEPPESSPILRKSTKVLGTIRRVRSTKVTQYHANIRENNGPSLGKIQVKLHHQRSRSAVKFEDVTRGKQKARIRRETSAVSGMRVMIMHQNRHRKPLSSEPSMTRGGSASRRRSVRGRSQTCRILRQPCRYNLKGPCTRSLCEYWHPPERQFRKTESGCTAGDKCLFPHSKVRKGAVAIVKTVPQLGCVSQDSETSGPPKSAKYLGHPRHKVLGSIRRVRFTQSTLRQAGIEDRGPSPGKLQVQIPHQRSPYALKFQDGSQEETERQE